MREVVSVFVIATKVYLNYAVELIDSAIAILDRDFDIQVILLTDQVPLAISLIKEQQGLEVVFVEIESFGWPEATLFRFALMSDHWSKVSGSIVMYVDADTQFVSSFKYNDLHHQANASNSGMTLVRHPGYFNRFFLLNFLFAFPVASFLPWKISRAASLMPWETRRRSSAHVPFHKRRTYVCGGVYWGKKQSFYNLCKELSSAVKTDEQNGIRAKHNDESHLNKWNSKHGATLATPAWAFASDYRNLRDIIPIIEVVHKPMNFERQPTT
jgi:hypothetical protein